MSAQGQGVVPFSLTHYPQTRHRFPRSDDGLEPRIPTLVQWHGSEEVPSPLSVRAARFRSPPRPRVQEAASFRDPATFPRALPAAPRLGTQGSVDREKRPYLRTDSHPTPKEAGGLRCQSTLGEGGGRFGSGRAPQPLDEREHVGMAMSNGSYTLRSRFVIMPETLEERVSIINEFLNTTIINFYSLLRQNSVFLTFSPISTRICRNFL